MKSAAKRPSVAVIGAGPAGLTAGYLLAKSGLQPIVLESDPVYVGGIARTVNYRGYHFDIGGHRFFSKSRDVEALWQELLPNDMLTRRRKSRIYYKKRFFAYPLEPLDALLTLGLLEAGRCGLSFARARAFPVRAPANFEDWVTNQFGSRLYEIFFKGYTEKVWGMSCREISADWAAQRIKGLSLASAVLNAFQKKRGAPVIKTLIDEFKYPRKGPGMMWEACAARIRALGGRVELGCTVTGLERLAGPEHVAGAGPRWRLRHGSVEGTREEIEVDHVVCSASMQELVASLAPAPDASVIRAARALRYRDFLTVALIARDRRIFDDHWIYIQDAGVKVGRLQNFKAWSPDMSPDPDMACYGLEYFCFEGDGLWAASDQDLIDLGKREIEALGLLRQADVSDGCVVRVKKAYPVYDDAYERNVDTIKRALREEYPGLQLVGRNGMHRYNNQDHAMMTAILAVENILAGETRYDLWRVNQDAEYIEAGRTGEEELVRAGGRAVPRRVQG